MEFVEAIDLKTDTATYLIYSAQGNGKTTSLKYIPGKKIIVDIDKSSGVLKGAEDITVVRLNTHNIWNEWQELIRQLNTKDLSAYDTIVIDNVSELFRSTLANLGREGKNNRVPTQADYQRVDFTILDSLRWIQTLGKRVVFTAWETSDTWTTDGGMVYNRAFPDIRKAIMNNFLGLCDVVARLVISTDEEGNVKRGFILQPSNTIFAKNRLDSRKGCVVEELISIDA